MVGVVAEYLILCVKEEPSIWNIHSVDYLKKELKVEAWNRVCSKLIPSWDKQSANFKKNTITTLRNKWLNIRVYYKNGKNSEKSENDKRKKYKHCDKLAFLDPTLDDDKRGSPIFEGAISITNSSSNSDKDEEENESPELDLVCESGATNNLTAQALQQWKDMPIGCSSPQGLSQAQRHDMNQQTAPNFLSINPSLAFLLSCSQEMDEMTANQRIEFKSGMIHLLKSLKYPIKTETD